LSIENKYLDQIEGRNPVSEALKAGRSINKIWTTKTNQRRDQRLHDLLNECRAKGVIIMEVERSVLDSMAESSGHQGIIAQVAPKNYIDPFTYLEELADQGQTTVYFIIR